MKIDMEAMVGKVKDELSSFGAGHNADRRMGVNNFAGNPDLEKALISKSKHINELEAKIRSLEDRISKLQQERD